MSEGRPGQTAPEPKTAIPTLLDVRSVARLLAVSPATVERLLVRGGLPFVDLSARLPGRRRRRLLRFDPVAVLAWARSRSGNGGAS